MQKMLPKWENNIIKNKSFKFALRIVKLRQYLNKEKKEYSIADQVLRSGTSIGANVSEAEYAQSRADFASKLSISLKEATETKYWLELLHESDYINEQQFSSIVNDLNIIIGTLINTLKKTKNNEKSD